MYVICVKVTANDVNKIKLEIKWTCHAVMQPTHKLKGWQTKNLADAMQCNLKCTFKFNFLAHVSLHKGMPLNWGYGQKFNGMPVCKLQVLAALCTPINGGGVVFDPLSLALVVLIFNHCVHVLLGTCSGLKWC